MPARRSKSKKLRELEEKRRILQREIERRKNAIANGSKPKRSSSKKMKTPFEECHSLLDRIKKMAFSKAFLEPVHWRELNIPSYPEIIKEPMDLSTVQYKLNSGRYGTPYDFAKDMRLVYQNACTFNKQGTLYHSAAMKYARKFEEEFEKKIIDLHEHGEFTRKIAKVTLALIKNSDTQLFRAPVNPTVLEIPDYLEVIRAPIDLGTILSRIHRYTRFQEFCADLYRVWDNCCRYNPKQNSIHQLALRLRELTTKHLRRFCPDEYLRWEGYEENGGSMSPFGASALFLIGGDGNMQPQAQPPLQEQQEQHQSQRSLVALDVSDAQFPSHMDEDMEDEQDMEDEADDDEDVDVQQQQQAQQSEEDNIFEVCDALMEADSEDKANELMIAHLLKKHELDTGNVQELNFSQKEELQRGIQCLDSDHFDPLINMLQSFIPDGEGDDDEVELDVDAIDAPLQVKMYNYMLQAVHQQEAEKVRALDSYGVQPLLQPAAAVAVEPSHIVDASMHEAADIQSEEQLKQEEEEEEEEQPQAQTQPHQVHEMEMLTAAMPSVADIPPQSIDDAANYTFAPTVNAAAAAAQTTTNDERAEEEEEEETSAMMMMVNAYSVHEDDDEEEEEDGDIDMHAVDDAAQPPAQSQSQQPQQEPLAEAEDNRDNADTQPQQQLPVMNEADHEEGGDEEMTAMLVDSELQSQQAPQETETPQQSEVQNDDAETPPQQEDTGNPQVQFPVTTACETQPNTHSVAEGDEETPQHVPQAPDEETEQETQLHSESTGHEQDKQPEEQQEHDTHMSDEDDDDDDEVDTPLAGDIVF